MIETLSNSALLHAYNSKLAELTGRVPVTRFASREKAIERLDKCLSELADKVEVTISEDGAVEIRNLPDGSGEDGKDDNDDVVAAAEESSGVPEVAPEVDVDSTPATIEDVPLPESTDDPPVSNEEDEDMAKAKAANNSSTKRSPGLARMEAKLGKKGTEDLRKKVVDDQKKALKEAAAPSKGKVVPMKAPAKKAEPARRGQVSRIEDDFTIKLIHNGDNPKRGTAADRFAHYKDGMTVAHYVKKLDGDRTQALRDLNWDAKQGWIKLVQPK